MGTNSLHNLAVYRGALKYVARTRPLVVRLKRQDPTLADQLHRAVISIPLNIAEGAGEYSTRDKARFYRYALRSTKESLAILDVLKEIALATAEEHDHAFRTGDRIAGMLTRLVLATTVRERKQNGPGQS
jgi:four helix bundle protein